MELNDIKIFIELYKNLSISKTAEKLSYTQSNVSTRLMKLEQEFNTTFFIRTKSGLQILPSADRFYNYAKRIEDTIDDIHKEFSLKKPILNIGSTQLLSKLYFPSLFLSDTSIKLHTTSVSILSRNFNNRIFDGIITHGIEEMAQDDFLLSKTEPLCWSMSSSIKERDDRNLNIIINRDKQCPLRSLTLKTIHNMQLKCSLVEVDTLELMLSLLYTSNCIALLPEKIILQDTQLVTYQQLPSLTFNVNIYCHSNINKELFSDLT